MKKIFICFLIVVLPIIVAGCVTLSTPLWNAAKKGDVKEVERLLSNGADMNARVGVGHDSYNALHSAALAGHANVATLLIEKGANVNERGGLKRTPLWLASFYGHSDVVHVLLEAGADPTIKGYTQAIVGYDKTPLQVAQKEGYSIIARMLREAEQKEYKELYAKESDQKSEKIPRRETSKPVIVKSDVDELPTIKAKTNKNAYAIVIGVEKYRQKLPKADFADNDARIMAEYLTKVMGYPEENVVTLLNDRALKSDFEKYFEKWLGNNVEKGSSVFIYFSGHGAPNTKTGDAYLVPYDGDPTFIDQTGYSLKRIYDALGKLPAKEIVVALDSCFSGAGGRSVLAEGARPLVMNLQTSFVLTKNIQVMAAASGDQISSTYKDKGHGLFTYFMLNGIKNEDVLNSDGSIAISDLFNYIKPRVERIARKIYNNEQTPQLIGAKKN